MSVDQTELLEGIKEKILSVKGRLQEQKGLNQELTGQNEALQKLVSEKQSQIEELEEKNQKLTLAKGIVAESGNEQEARLQINRIVREIDKCIALLNRT